MSIFIESKKKILNVNVRLISYQSVLFSHFYLFNSSIKIYIRYSYRIDLILKWMNKIIKQRKTVLTYKQSNIRRCDYKTMLGMKEKKSLPYNLSVYTCE